jgi:hypothetical protein
MNNDDTKLLAEAYDQMNNSNSDVPNNLMNKEHTQFVNSLWEDTIKPDLLEYTNYKSRAEMLEMVNAIYIKCIEMGKSITDGDYDYMIDLD